MGVNLTTWGIRKPLVSHMSANLLRFPKFETHLGVIQIGEQMCEKSPEFPHGSS